MTSVKVKKNENGDYYLDLYEICEAAGIDPHVVSYYDIDNVKGVLVLRLYDKSKNLLNLG